MSIQPLNRDLQSANEVPTIEKPSPNREEIRLAFQAKERIERLTLPQFTNIQESYIDPYLETGELNLENVARDLAPNTDNTIRDLYIPVEVQELAKKKTLDSSEVQRLDDFCRARDEVVVLTMVQWTLSNENFRISELPEAQQFRDELEEISSEMESLEHRQDTIVGAIEQLNQLPHDERIVHGLVLRDELHGLAYETTRSMEIPAKGALLLDAHRNKPLNYMKRVLMGLNSIEEYEQKGKELKGWLEEHRGDLAKIVELDLSGYGITSVPPFVFAFGGLEHLNLNSNQLLDLPHELSNLSGLKSLSLKNNLLRAFPQAVPGLVELEYLDLESNQLIEVPPSIINLTKLEELNLNGNPIPSLPNECRILYTKHKLYQGIRIWENVLSCYPIPFKSNAIDPITTVDERESLPKIHIPGEVPRKFDIQDHELISKCIEHDLFYDAEEFKRQNPDAFNACSIQ